MKCGALLVSTVFLPIGRWAKTLLQPPRVTLLSDGPDSVTLKISSIPLYVCVVVEG